MNSGVLVCHCLLDPLTRALGTKEIRRGIIKVLIDLDISVIQLPCPEMMYGFGRMPRNKEEYDTPEYREHCRTLAEDVGNLVEEYKSFTIFGLVSVGGSPSCGFQRTHKKGEHVSEPGIFMEEIVNVFKKMGIEMNIKDHELLESESEIKQFLKKKERT